MPELTLTITLESQTTFGRGDGVAGLVDIEVLHDDVGLPYLNGRGLKGTLMATCAEILSAPALSGAARDHFTEAAQTLFGAPGSGRESQGRAHFGHALLPKALRVALEYESQYQNNPFSREDVLAAFTTLRRQTKVDATTGAAADSTLRAMRVLDKGLVFESVLLFDTPLDPVAGGLLAACAAATRHLGTRRARGLGRCTMSLLDAGKPVSEDWLKAFEMEVAR